MIIEYSEFSINAPQDRIEREVYETVGCLGSGWGTEHITFIDKTFDTYKDAQSYLLTLDDGYEGFAAKFKTYNKFSVREDPAVMSIRKEIHNLQDSLKSYKENTDISKTINTPFINCPKCKSKLASSYFVRLHTNYCPLCFTDFRSETTLARIKYLENFLDQKRNELMVAEDNAKRSLVSTGLNWLVQYKIACKEPGKKI